MKNNRKYLWIQCSWDVQLLDSAKTFDIVWSTLSELDVPRHSLSILIKSLYFNNLAQVNIEGEYSVNFKEGKCVRECWILFAILFNCFGERLIRNALEDWEGGASVCRKKNRTYLDDTVILAKGKKKMYELLQRGETAKQVRMLAYDSEKNHHDTTLKTY